MPLKIIHTSDWHLGKKLYKESRHEEHVHFLSWLEETIINQEIDVLIVSGDIYDSPNPPAESQKLLYKFLSTIPDSTQVFIISGNHDSSRGLMAPIPLLPPNIKIIGELSPELENNIFKVNIRDIKLSIFALPFFRSHEIEKVCKKLDINKELKENINQIASMAYDENADFNILMSHHLFGSFLESGSEHTISLTGINSIDCKSFKNYDYLALGHIHKKQKVSSEPLAVYPGSPIPMRFSESNNKFITELRLGEKLEYKEICIPSSKSLHRLKCHKNDIESELMKINIEDRGSLSAYIELEVILDEPEYNLFETCEVITNKHNFKLISLIPNFKTSVEAEEVIHNVENMNTMELFELYYNDKYGHAPQENITSLFKSLLNEVNTMEKENEIP